MRFWDSSAIVPLLCREPDSARMRTLLERDRGIVVWAWTPVECCSALVRRHREGRISSSSLRRDLQRLKELSEAWTTIIDAGSVAARAERCLRVHALRAADAGQLAAALLVAEKLASNLPFVTLDQRLARAAEMEGLKVLGAQ